MLRAVSTVLHFSVGPSGACVKHYLLGSFVVSFSNSPSLQVDCSLVFGS